MSSRFEVTIVGAGPVGLLLACFLGSKGLRVLLLERRSALPTHSQAIGITPPSLQILNRLGLRDAFTSRGVRVRDCHVHGESGHLGVVSFREISGPDRFILSLPQAETVSLLRQQVAFYPSVTFLTQAEVTGVNQYASECLVTFQSEAGVSSVATQYVAVCDGARSAIRETLGLARAPQSYGVHFVMGDFIDRTSLADDAHLYFTATGSIESFPLPGGLRRWIAQTHAPLLDDTDQALLASLVRMRTGMALEPADQVNQSTFTPRRLNCTRYHQERIVMCGDAAHLMSPVGGQGMNTGFADAEFLADALLAILSQGRQPAPLLAAYTRYRHRAAQAAISRAGMSMWLGTWTGKLPSILRDFIIRRLLCSGPLRRHVGPFYAMLTIPYNTTRSVPPDILHSQTA